MINILNKHPEVPVERIYYLLKKLERIKDTALILKNMGLILKVTYKDNLYLGEFK